MARSEPDFTTRMVSLMLASAQRRGLEVGPILERFRLSREAVNLEHPGKEEITILPSALRELAEAVAQALGDPHFGLHLANDVPKGAYGVGEFVVCTAPTVRGVIENFVRFNAIISPHQVFHLTEVGDDAEVHTHTPRHHDGIGRHLNEYSVAIELGVLSTMADIEVRRVWFSSPPPPPSDTLAKHFGTSAITFNAATTGFALPKAVLDRPNRRGDEALNQFLEQLAKQALDARPKSDELVDRLRVLVRDALKEGEPVIERLSSRMHMSARTLQRRLSDAKTSFQQVLDDVRFDLARGYLRDERLDISQVAFLLGYSELRAFDRAFKRWAGLAPSEWRNRPA